MTHQTAARCAAAGAAVYFLGVTLTTHSLLRLAATLLVLYWWLRITWRYTKGR